MKKLLSAIWAKALAFLLTPLAGVAAVNGVSELIMVYFYDVWNPHPVRLWVVTILCAVVAVGSLLFSLSAAGHWPGHEGVHLTWLDRIPLARLGEEKLIMMDAQSKVKELMSREFERHQVIPDILFNYDQVLCMANLVRSCRYVGIISVAQGQQALGCEGLAIRPFEEPVVFDVGFFLKKGRYLPKLGWELIRFIQENTLRGGT